MGKEGADGSRDGRASRFLQWAGTGLLVVGVLLGFGGLAGVLVLTSSAGGEDAPGATEPRTTVTGAPTATPLRVAAARQELLIGAAVTVDPLRDDREYARTLGREYNAVATENAMKWDVVHPEEDRYHFRPADSIVSFARSYDMTVRGHTLVWHRAVPSWVTNRMWTRAELARVLHDHIRTVVGRYRGKVAQWDVVNEAIDDEGNLRDSVWMRVIGPEYIDLAFRWAHEADPNAQLFYNDYDLEQLGPKTRAVQALVRGLIDRDVPIDGVGIQGHELAVHPPSRLELEGALRTFADLGLDVAITELDVGILLPATAEKLAEQAHVYQDALDACLAVSRCGTFVTWGFTDQHSWVPDEHPGFGDALPFDASLEPKPALAVLRAGLLRGRG